MLNAHREIFYQVARQLKCWIHVREPNTLGDSWVGQPGYTPKPVTCKAKSSNNRAFRFAGLVVDPNRVGREAFQDPATYRLALESWSKFTESGRLPAGYAVVEWGTRAGLVTFEGKFIFPDYDLFWIESANAEGDVLSPGQKGYQSSPVLFPRVEKLLNEKFGIPMIQHGSEFDWDQGIGTRHGEWILSYGPTRSPRNPRIISRISHTLH